MIEKFESVISILFRSKEKEDTFSIFDPIEQFDEERTDNKGVAQSLNAAFLIALAGRKRPASERAKHFLNRMADSPEWASKAKFYQSGINLIHEEINAICKENPDFAEKLNSLSEWVSSKKNLNNTEETTEKIWSVFFPEAVGIRAHKQKHIESLRAKRTVTVAELNTNPITDPARQILFTSNVLLTVPPTSNSPDELYVSESLKEKILQTSLEPQLYYYDHPIQIGIEPEKNEVLYGLRGLEETIRFESASGNMSREAKLTCVLSVSVTHRGLQNIAKTYLEEEFSRSGRLKNLKIYVFTEADTQRAIDEILAPAAEHYLQHVEAKEALWVLGVDGEYGRHYSFVKAIAAFWRVFIDPGVKATFKIDLDQVFPQNELVEHTGASAFEHFQTSLWGAHGIDSSGQPLEFGMIAGALVNESDIRKSLFTPDVPFPARPLSPDEYVFFSVLPQALSTQAEMMTRYTSEVLDGNRRCIQRIHVTGGTNGILIDSLRRHQPFTPSFIGRAEDQAYILSVLSELSPKLAYVHKDGLMMRHDKEAFAHEAIQSASVGKLIGDYIRILYFSAYAKVLSGDVEKLKKALDPFTGCFISRIPATVVYLRFVLKAASFFTASQDEEGLEFITIGAQRISKALDFVRGEDSPIKQQYEKEKLGWSLYYDILSSIERALANDDGFAQELRRRAKKIINQCAVSFDSKVPRRCKNQRKI
jgi:hypothetical protein